MAHDADLRVITPRLLAAGNHVDVLAARSGTKPWLVAVSAGEDGRPYCRLWDVVTGTVLGPPVLGSVEDMHAFDVAAAADGDRPILVVDEDEGMWVIDARTGARVAACTATPRGSTALCLATLDGRSVVVSVRFAPGAFAPCKVWDAESGRQLREFEVWFPHYGAVAEPVLLAGPEIGDGAVLFTSQEERVDRGWPADAYDHAYLVLIDLTTGEEVAQIDGGPPVALHLTTAGPVAVFRSSDALATVAVRLPGGEHVRTLTGEDVSWLDTLAVGSVAGRDLVVGGRWHGAAATVWDLTGPEPLARITAPDLQAAAITRNGTIVLATAHGLLTVDAGTLPVD
jgi:hypothetical protein